MHAWRVGTSGYSYVGWRGSFYPERLPASRFLEFYARHFDIVELNVTFYRTPKETAFRTWAATVPPGFSFVLKVPRRVTHLRCLGGCREEMERFFDRARLLGSAWIASLLQLPPTVRFDPARLESFLAELPAGLPPLTWEVRHPSFAEEDAVAWFRTHGQSLVVADSGGRYPTVRAFTAAPVYLRLHGPGQLHASSYGRAELTAWADWVRDEVPHGAQVLAFFNNDAGGFAAANARELKDLVGQDERPLQG
jgi:uncharacterized protein YecE (DUF72 family)